MTGLGFYAPLKPASHPTPSGDREMARGLIAALDLAGYSVEIASEVRAHDKTGDASVQRDIADQAKVEIRRILKATPDWAAWITYHSYYKSPDLIGPAVCSALKIPYLQIESTRARKRLEGPWSSFATASEAASDQAAAIFYMTAQDQDALQAYAPDGQILTHLHPFLAAKTLPEQAQPADHSILSIGMFRSRAKMDSYRLIAQTLPLLESPNWHLTIVGDGPERDRIEALFAPFGDQVQLAGKLSRDQIDTQLQSTRAFFWPGVDEAYGMVYLEAQAAGVPVVAQDRAGVRDVSAVKGCDVNAGAAALAKRLDQLLSDDKLHKQAAKQARDSIQAAHLLPNAARALHDTIETLI